jgi:hypothetical protein
VIISGRKPRFPVEVADGMVRDVPEDSTIRDEFAVSACAHCT